MLCRGQKATRTRSIKIIIVCLIVLSTILNSPRFFEFAWDMSALEMVVRTDFGCSYAFQAGYMLWFTMAVRFLIPVMILAYTNIQLFRKVTFRIEVSTVFPHIVSALE